MNALGVDVGSDAIRLALLDTAGRSPRLVGSWTEPRAAGADVADDIRRAVAAHCPAPPEAVATALPGRHATFRLLHLPFSDPARLAATVPFEIESLVPFDLAQALVSFATVDRSAGGATVLAALAPVEAVRRHVESMQAAGLDPAVVDLGTAACADLFEAAPGELLVVEPRDDGGVALLRDGRIAGLHVLDAAGPAEIERRLGWAAQALAGDSRPRVVGVGPGAEAGESLAGLPGWAAEAPVEHLRAVALAARAAGLGRAGLNFRTGELAYRAPSEEARRQLRRTGLLAAATALLGLLALGGTIAARRAELSALRERIARSVDGVVAQPSPGNERAQLEAAVESLARRRDNLTGSRGDRPSALELLRSLAGAIPERTSVEVDDLVLDDAGLRLHAKTDSYESVDVVKRALEAIPGARDVQVKDSRTAVDGRVEFRASMAFGRETAS